MLQKIISSIVVAATLAVGGATLATPSEATRAPSVQVQVDGADSPCPNPSNAFVSHNWKKCGPVGTPITASVSTAQEL